MVKNLAKSILFVQREGVLAIQFHIENYIWKNSLGPCMVPPMRKYNVSFCTLLELTLLVTEYLDC